MLILIIFLLLLVVILLYLLFWPVPVRPIKWTPPEPPKLVGVYAVNQKLSSAERLDAGGVGPEDVIFNKEGWLYSGLEDGRIVRMRPDGSELETFAQTAGRPLGLAFDGAGNLIVADADMGLLLVDPEGKLQTLTDAFAGRKLILTNHLDVAADGTIYFSESSDRFPLHDYRSDILESRPNGRLLAYAPEVKETRLVLDKLHFANGVAVSPDQSFVLIVEGSRYRLKRLWLKGPRAGEVELFIDNLPGFPDNLHSNGRNIFWLTLVSPRKQIVDSLAGLPFIRKMIYRLPESLKPNPDRYGIVLGLNENGEVVHNLQDPSGDIAETSGAIEYEGVLYIGTIGGDAVGRLPMGDLV